MPKEKKKTTTALATTGKGKTLAKSTGAIDLLGDAGQNHFRADDLAIPRLSIIQAQSPQVIKTKPEFIKGAEVGDLFDTVANSVFSGDKGIVIIPCHYRRAYIEWYPRESKKGKGFVADHGSDDAILKQCVKDDSNGKMMIVKKGTQIVTTSEYYVLVVNEKGGFAPYILSMTSSQLKKARRWNTMISQLQVNHPQTGELFNPAMFYRSYQLTTTPEQNDQGTWFGYKITPGEDVLNLKDGEKIYIAARDFRKAIAEGKVQAAPQHVDETATPGGDDSSPL